MILHCPRCGRQIQAKQAEKVYCPACGHIFYPLANPVPPPPSVRPPQDGPPSLGTIPMVLGFLLIGLGLVFLVPRDEAAGLFVILGGGFLICFGGLLRLLGRIEYWLKKILTIKNKNSA